MGWEFRVLLFSWFCALRCSSLLVEGLGSGSSGLGVRGAAVFVLQFYYGAYGHS